MNDGRGGVRRSLAVMAENDWVRQTKADHGALTPAGIRKAEQLMKK